MLLLICCYFPLNVFSFRADYQYYICANVIPFNETHNF